MILSYTQIPHAAEMVPGSRAISPVNEETVQIKVPKNVNEQLVMLAVERSETVCTVILRSLENFGLLIDAGQILDRRKSR